MYEENTALTPKCKEHFITSNNSIKVLLCMGIKNDNGEVIKDFDPLRFPVTFKK